MNVFCGNEEMLAAYLDRMLPDEERILYEKHLSTCPACMSELVSSSAAYEALANRSRTARAGGRRFNARDIVRPHISSSKGMGISPLRRFGIGWIAAASFVIVLSSAVLILHRHQAGLSPDRREVTETLKALWPGDLRLSHAGDPPARERGRIR